VSVEILVTVILAIVVDLAMLKIKIPLIQIFIGLASCIVAFLAAAEIPLFPWTNIILAILGIGDMLMAIEEVRR